MNVRYLLVLLSLWAGMMIAGERQSEEEAVRAAILDYVEGVYNVQPERIRRSVHPSLRKHGFYFQNGAYTEYPMTFEELVNLAAHYNEKGWIPKDAPKEITIFEIKDQTASAKLVAQWGQDYFHLAKYDGKWMITNVLWQSLANTNP